LVLATRKLEPGSIRDDSACTVKSRDELGLADREILRYIRHGSVLNKDAGGNTAQRLG
jgi:hypothetical protein